MNSQRDTRVAKYVRIAFAQRRPLYVLCGETGVGKTETLRALNKLGESVIDLEAIARHCGSAFGGFTGMGPQPTNDEFQATIARDWQLLESADAIWIETKATALGSVRIPPPLRTLMQCAPRVVLAASEAARLARLLRRYGGISRSELHQAWTKITSQLGQSTNRMIDRAIRAQDLQTVVSLLLPYYDAAYLRQDDMYRGDIISNINVHDDDLQTARQVRDALPVATRISLG